MTVQVQARLRETARLLSSHYSTQIEGNRLTLEGIKLFPSLSVLQPRFLTKSDNQCRLFYGPPCGALRPSPIVTGDKNLLKIKKVKGIEMLNPTRLCQRLGIK